MPKFLARAFVALAAISAPAMGAPTFSVVGSAGPRLKPDSETLVVVMEKQDGVRKIHSQPATPAYCHALQQLFRELNENGQPLVLTTLYGPREALTLFCVEANGSGFDWTGAVLTAEQIQQRADELIIERQK
jgi:hypothetical protein